MKKKRAKSNYDLLDKNPDNWRGIFYYNPRDSRILVPKMNPRMGYTLNFGNHFSYLFLIGILVLIIAISFI